MKSLQKLFISCKFSAVPLSPQHPEALLQYYIDDTNSNLLVSSPKFGEKMGDLSKKANVKLYVLDEDLLKNSKTKNSIDTSMLDNILPLDFYRDHDAMILYTSGTTGKPKGGYSIFTSRDVIA